MILFFNLRRLRLINQSLTPEATHTPVHTFVSSRLDGCNYYTSCKLYRMLRLVSSKEPEDQIILHLIYTILTGYRFNSSLAVLVYKYRHGMAPQYLQTYWKPASTFTSRQLRYAHAARLTFIRTRMNYGDCSFAFQGPQAWNGLPAEMCNGGHVHKQTEDIAVLCTKRICCIVRLWRYRNSLITIIITSSVTWLAFRPFDIPTRGKHRR